MTLWELPMIVFQAIMVPVLNDVYYLAVEKN